MRRPAVLLVALLAVMAISIVMRSRQIGTDTADVNAPRLSVGEDAALEEGELAPRSRSPLRKSGPSPIPTNTLAALVSRAAESDPYDPDVTVQLRDAKAFCSLSPADTPGLVESYEASGMIPTGDNVAAESVRFLGNVRRRYCANASVPGDIASDADLAAHAPQQDLRRIEQIRAALATEQSPMLRTALLAELEQLAMSTASPAAFVRATSTLIDRSHGGWNFGRERLAGIADRNRARRIQQAAAVTVYCQLANTCGPESLTVLAQCAPSRCYPGITLDNAFRDSMSPSELVAYRAMVADLSRRRERPGG